MRDNTSSAPLFCLVDVNNFYVSCERVFEPGLHNKPVVVLSNNDGCAVSRSNEVKKLKVPMASAWFKMKDVARKHNIRAFSSNYTLYADMSQRVINVLREFSPQVEVYSIDEMFLLTHHLLQRYGNAAELGAQIRQRIDQYIGLPVCAGFGATKTLAKFANHLAKKNVCFNGVCDLSGMPTQEREYWMRKVDVGEVWGVGRRTTARLHGMQIKSVYDLAHADPKHIRQHFSVVMERTADELRGVMCLPFTQGAPLQQQIMSSRSFGSTISASGPIEQAIAWHTQNAAQRLRAQQLRASALYVFIRTNPFAKRHPQCNQSITLPLPEPTSDTRVLVQAAIQGLRQIYQPGFAYKKCGVMLLDLAPQSQYQGDLFAHTSTTQDAGKAAKAMAVIDQLNAKFGKQTVRTGSVGFDDPWAMNCAHRSAHFTTDWNELKYVR